MGTRHLFRSTRVSPDSRVGVLRHGVERRSNTLLARDHLPQFDRKAVHEARPHRQVRLGAHAVVDGVKRDAEVAGGADSDAGLSFDSRIVEITPTDRARAAAEQAGAGRHVGARSPLHQDPARLRPLAVRRESEIRAALATEARSLVEAALACRPERALGWTGGGLDKPHDLRPARSLNARKALPRVGLHEPAALQQAL